MASGGQLQGPLLARLRPFSGTAIGNHSELGGQLQAPLLARLRPFSGTAIENHSELGRLQCPCDYVRRQVCRASWIPRIHLPCFWIELKRSRRFVWGLSLVEISCWASLKFGDCSRLESL